VLSSVRNKVTEHSVRKISARSASSKKNARRERSISCSRNPLDYEFDEIQRTQGVHGRLKYSRRSSSGGVT
jgi:hypothetical protein